MTTVTFSMFKLLKIEEFDAVNASKNFSDKNAYFACLATFTNESEFIIKTLNISNLDNGEFDFVQFEISMDRLLTLLADIGAISLAFGIENLNKHLQTKQFELYAKELAVVFSDIKKLRTKIIEAKEPEEVITYKHQQNTQQPLPQMGQSPLQGGQMVSKNKVAIPKDVFERFYMLLENFEFGRAYEALKAIDYYSYNEEIDHSIKLVMWCLEAFDYDTAVVESNRLIELVHVAQNQGSGKKRVLAIDDMPDALRNIKAMLRDEYTVFAMAECNAALQFLKSNTADIILLDIEMPEMDGFALLQLIRRLPGYSKVPVVFITGNTSADNLQKAIGLGAKDFIRKPVDIKVLREKLGNILSS